MNAAVQAVMMALYVAESNSQLTQEPYIGFHKENYQKIMELREGLARLEDRKGK